VNPRDPALLEDQARPIAGRAGDLIIWHQALPHGATPNRARVPRIVQYINMRPPDFEQSERWI
jgi:ectoine hydroxylase-related dioxygenase (phytanoyl-CoA dioxygenase family)